MATTMMTTTTTRTRELGGRSLRGSTRLECLAGKATSRQQQRSWPKRLLSHTNGRRSNIFLHRTRALDEGTDDADFEDRLAKLRAAKGTKGRGQGGTKSKVKETGSKAYDYTGETVFYEGRPSAGDLAVNVALGATLLWLPLSIAAVGRFAWVNYKITDKRISVSNTSPVANDESQLDCPYAQVSDVSAIGRGLGLWGDMVVKLKDGSKIEIRSIDRWQEVRDYILARVAEVSKESADKVDAKPAGF
ncbi:hypothetical protein A3770_04p28050 [Chloropicon primus]|uniref:YdbS-like PH domain-containing protein n=1 Tax=Chloropicon primus TaxID=1764295 RepID=A0A5B8MIL0_9CHLO|nr:hypothetical protein A3770_04p28050 [Chloropicon primus]|eukprot:QDZ20287.1 hypothetical protein A3770_04p28050 [Chloropicon primus]